MADSSQGQPKAPRQRRGSNNGRRSVPHKRVHAKRHYVTSRISGVILYVLFVVLTSAILATAGWLWARDLLSLGKDYTSVLLTVPDSTMVQVEEEDDDGKTVKVDRADIDAIADQLVDEGLIKYKWLFKLYAWFSNADSKIIPGTYELNTEMDYRALVVNMSSSSTTRQEIQLMIPEGYNIDQIFALLEENGVCTVEELQDMAANHDYRFDWLLDIPLGDYHRLEGYLFPDTYNFYVGEDPLYAINKMLVNFHNKISDYLKVFEAEDSPYTLHQIVTIASMIEKETDGTDYRNISSVIRNRLENPNAETAGFLQIDATLVYINGGNKPTIEDRQIDSPYNTYLYPGLPAGPICNPGWNSLYAALEPQQTSYYFYVLNPETGEHDYSKTLAEHQAKVDKYARWAAEHQDETAGE